MHEKLTAEIKMDGADAGIELEPGEFLAVISDPTLDRDGEILDAGAFEPLPDKITIDIDHGMSVRSTVGSGKPFYEGDQLMIRGRFASTDLAKDTRTLVTEGHIDRMSVAFGSAKREQGDDGVPHLVKGELLNVAIVAIPANPSAAILAAKSHPGFMSIDEVRKLYGVPAEVVVIERPEGVAEESAADWSAAVTEFARSWQPEATKGDNEEISTDGAPEGAASDEAAKAAELEAAARQRRRAVERQKASMALASTPT